ncbi:MAG: nuclear transport factor 2 family protein [Burkholderiales bacterium]|nr:nuclear transport factor 2 family protein [Burkholderiales bacterium]
MPRVPSRSMYVLITHAACGFASIALPQPAMAIDFQSSAIQSATNPVGEAPTKQALDALREMLAAFEKGDSAKVEAGIQPTLVGLALLVKSIQDSLAQQREIRIHLQNISVAANSEDVLISADWEKRYLSTAGLAPGLAKGRATFVFRHVSAQWKLAGMTGNSLFAGGL